MRIRVLPRGITEKIAAGEVVERPASVIKELLENALDAEPSRALVEVGHQVVDRLEVTDDGIGMTPDEVLVAVQRHATSKISCEEDLFRIRTLGFRGEALASIAAVSDLEIESRTAEAATGVRVSVSAAGTPQARQAGVPKGTRVIVRNLFQSTPARLKFLKSRQTEVGLIMDTFVRLALSRKEVALQLKRPGRPDLYVPAVTDLRQRVGSLLGWEMAEGLQAVYGEAAGCVLEGLIGAAGVHRGTAREMFLLVNRRPVRDPALQRAVRQAYGGALPRGRFPVAVLLLTMPCSDLDVNVHPAKLEVRFSRPDQVRDLITRAVSRAVATRLWTGWASTSEQPVAAGTQLGQPEPATGGQKGKPGTEAGLSADTEKPGRAGLRAGAPGEASPQAALSAEVLSRTPLPVRSGLRILPAGLFARFRLLGQFRETYLVCEYEDQLLLIDQHAAHERIAFEKILEAYEKKKMVRQALLLPPIVELAPREAECVQEQLGLLQGCGLEVEHYGGRSFAVKALPLLIATADPARLLRDVAAELATMDRAMSLETRCRQVFASMACHSAVRAGLVMEREEIEALLAYLDYQPGLLQCPHGRPVLIAFPLQEIQKRFLRT